MQTADSPYGRCDGGGESTHELSESPSAVLHNVLPRGIALFADRSATGLLRRVLAPRHLCAQIVKVAQIRFFPFSPKEHKIPNRRANFGGIPGQICGIIFSLTN